MYQDLLDKHQDLTNKYKEQLNKTPYFEFDDKHIFNDNDSTSSMVTTASSRHHQDFIRTPIKNRPCPIITRSTPSSSIGPHSRSHSTMPPSFRAHNMNLHNVGHTLDEMNSLNQTIKELRHQLLRSKQMRSLTREASGIHNKYALSTDDGRSTTSTAVVSSSKPQTAQSQTAGYINLDQIAIDIAETDDGSGPITIGQNFDCDTSTSTGSTFQGVITYDMMETTKGNEDDGTETRSTRSQSCSDLRKPKKRSGWWRLFGLCSSPRNREDR